MHKQTFRREQSELDELLSDIYRGIERLPDEPHSTSTISKKVGGGSNSYHQPPATTAAPSEYIYRDLADDYEYDPNDRFSNPYSQSQHTVLFTTLGRRGSKELTERQIKEKAMIEELKRNIKSGALTLRNSFKSSSNQSKSFEQPSSSAHNKQDTTSMNNNSNNNNQKTYYNTTNNRSTASRSPTPNRVTFMRQHSDLTNYRSGDNNQQQSVSMTNAEPIRLSGYPLQPQYQQQQQPTTYYTINQRLVAANGVPTKQPQSILTNSTSNQQQQQQQQYQQHKPIYANPHNSLLQHKREQQLSNRANLNQCSMKEFDELDSLLNSLKIPTTPSTTSNIGMNRGMNNISSNQQQQSSSTTYRAPNYVGGSSNTLSQTGNKGLTTTTTTTTQNAYNSSQQFQRQQTVDSAASAAPLYAKVQKTTATPLQSNTIQNYQYRPATNISNEQQQSYQARTIPINKANEVKDSFYNSGTTTNGHNRDDDSSHIQYTTIENNQHQPIYGQYQHRRQQQHQQEDQDPPFDILPSMEYYQLLSKFNTVKNDYWYKPKMSRETAVNLLRDKPPGTFIVRDSTSFNGAYGLAVKVAKLPQNVLTNANLRTPSSNELIRHFLIESTPKGVRLKGYPNEPVFSSLPALVYQHSITELALPCRLSIPRADVEDPKFAEKQRKFYEDILTEKAEHTKGIYGTSGTRGGYRNYEGVPIHSEHRIIFDRI